MNGTIHMINQILYKLNFLNFFVGVTIGKKKEFIKKYHENVISASECTFKHHSTAMFFF